MERIIPGEFYHIFNHANGFEDLFLEEKNYPFFLEKYRLYSSQVAETLAYCLMPNHYHTLVKVKPYEALIENGIIDLEMDDVQISNRISKQMSRFFSSYTQAFNKVYKRRGSMFVKNYKRKRIADERYLREIILYIHLNPVKHRFRKNPGDWSWSTFNRATKEQRQFYIDVFGSEENLNRAYDWKLKKLLFIEEFDDI